MIQEDLEKLETMLNQNTDNDMYKNIALYLSIYYEWELGVYLCVKKGANIEEYQCYPDDVKSCLHFASYLNSYKMVKFLLDLGANPNSVDSMLQTPLFSVVRSGNIHLAELLLSYGADINFQDKYQYSPLMWFCSDSDAHCIKNKPMFEFLVKKGAHLELKNLRGMTTLHVSCAAGNFVAVKELIGQCDLGVTDDVEENTALHIACSNGSSDIVELLLGAGSKLECRNKYNETPLLCTVKIPQISPLTYMSVNFLLERKADVNACDMFGNAPLHAVSYRNHFLVRLFLRHNADPNQLNKRGNSPLHYACMGYDVSKCVRELLVYGAYVNVLNKNGKTPLHFASRPGNAEVIISLLEAGTNPNLQDKRGNTPLLLFLHNRRGADNSSVSVLLHYHSDVNVRNKKMDTPLIYATLHQNSKAVEELLSANADVNAQTSFGDTSLHLACRRRSLTVISLLLNNGADINVKNNEGDTPLHAALCSYVCNEVVALLLERGPAINIRNGRGETALHLAVLSQSLKTVQLLLLAGFFVNAVDNHGNTPLHLMRHYFYDGYKCYEPVVLRELLAWGASVIIMNKDRIPPLGHIPKSYSRKSLGKEVKRHIIMCKAASVTLEPPLDVHLFFGFDYLSDFQEECLLEVDRMKARRLGWNTVFDILCKYRDPTYLSNRDLEFFVENLCQYPEDFPIYKSMLISTYRRARQRVALMGLSQYLLPLPFPQEIRRKILVHFEDRHLETLTS